MKIKNLVLSTLFSASYLLVFAQNSEFSSARTNYENFWKLKEANSMTLAIQNLKAAKTSIDKAALHTETIEEPATWTYKSLIYGELALMDTDAQTSKPLIEEALAAHKKATNLDKASENKELLDNANREIFGQYEVQQGVNYYNSKNFADAYAAFINALGFVPGEATIKDYARFAAFNLGLDYDKIGDYEKAEKAYLDALKIDPNYLDAITTIGVSILNKGINLIQKANQLTLGKAEIEKALPYLLRSSELDPKSRPVLESLRTYYQLKGDSRKTAEIAAQIKGL